MPAIAWFRSGGPQGIRTNTPFSGTLFPMGSLSSFECEKCGYTAEVSGGQDAGFEAATQTILCDGCRELVDVLVGKRKGADQGFDPVSPRCPKCRGDSVTPWDESHPCPKCGSSMTEVPA